MIGGPGPGSREEVRKMDCLRAGSSFEAGILECLVCDKHTNLLTFM